MRDKFVKMEISVKECAKKLGIITEYHFFVTEFNLGSFKKFSCGRNKSLFFFVFIYILLLFVKF